MNHQTRPTLISNPDRSHPHQLSLRVVAVLSGIRAHHLVAFAVTLLVIPVLTILDVLLFQFTRPTCAGCSSLAEFMAGHSTTIAYIQGNRSLSDLLQLIRKSV